MGRDSEWRLSTLLKCLLFIWAPEKAVQKNQYAFFILLEKSDKFFHEINFLNFYIFIFFYKEWCR